MLIINGLSLSFVTFENDAIGPSEPLPYIVNLDLFETALWQLRGISQGGDEFYISGSITSVSVVPEPSAYAFIVGVLGFGFVYLRRKRR